MMDLDDLPEAPLEGELVEVDEMDLTTADGRREKLRELEDELLTQSLGVVGAAMDFAEIDPKKPKEMPEVWKDLPPEEAIKKLRIAQYALLPKKEAPTALDIATKLGVSIIKARAVEKAGPRDIAIDTIQIVAPQQYPELEVRERE